MRLNFVFFCILGTAGLLFFGDWQSFGDDPCNNFSTYNASLTDSSKQQITCDTTGNRTGCEALHFPFTVSQLDSEQSNHTVLHICDARFELNMSAISKSCPRSVLCRKFEIWNNTMCEVSHSEGLLSYEYIHVEKLPNRGVVYCLESIHEQWMNLSNSTFTRLIDTYDIMEDFHYHKRQSFFQQLKCEESSFNCYWNQHSDITQEFCTECPSICRGRHKSLHFSQVILATAFLVLHNAVGRWIVYLFAVRKTPKNFMVRVFVLCKVIYELQYFSLLQFH